MLRKLYRKIQARRRARALLNVRQEFAKAGYPLDRFRDAEIEAAIKPRTGDIDALTWSAKSIYRVLKRLRYATGG